MKTAIELLIYLFAIYISYLSSTYFAANNDALGWIFFILAATISTYVWQKWLNA